MAHTRKPRTCQVCEQEYRPTYRDQRCCGRACGVELRRWHDNLGKAPSSPVRYQDCAQCGRVFVVGKWASPLYCGHECRRQAVNARVRAHRRERWNGTCRKCSAQVEFPQRTCEPCKDQSARAARRRGKRARRARRLGADTVEYIHLPDIAKRDGYRCGICRKRVNMDLVVPHPQAPTLDHVLPLARGGEHTKANTQLAHFLCNSRKGDRVGDVQMALFG